MDAAGQQRYSDSAMGVALALSLAAHLPLLLLWKDTSPAPPVMAGGRVHLQLTAANAAVPAPAPAQQETRPRQPAPPQSDPRQTKETSSSKANTVDASAAQATPAEPPAPPVEPVRSRAEPLPRSKRPIPARPRPSAAPETTPPPARDLAVQDAPPPPPAKPEKPSPAIAATREPSPAPAAREAQASGQSAGPSPAHRKQLQQALSRALLDHFIYPLQARRRHWEGEVVLRVTILRDGRIGDAQVDRSSGHRLLDQAALDSLKQIPSLAGITLGQETELLLPVIYRLRG